MSAQRTELVKATALGTVLQLGMVLTGHWLPSVAQLFALVGVTISFVAGLAFTTWARPEGLGVAAGGGAVAGGVCALLGIAVSLLLGDVTASVLVFGTVGSSVTGALGGVAGRYVPRGAPAARA